MISSFGGKSKGLQNDGINIQAVRGASVRAVENGVVAYAHNDALMVKRGDKIAKGQNIATVGSTGSVKTPQLHFELRRGKEAVDPLKHLPKPRA